MTTDPMITLVNRFTLNKGIDPADFESEFAKIGTYFAEQPGILGYTLSRDVKDPSDYVNVALWSDAASLQAAVHSDGFSELVTHLRALCTSQGSVFQERVKYVSEAIHAY